MKIFWLYFSYRYFFGLSFIKQRRKVGIRAAWQDVMTDFFLYFLHSWHSCSDKDRPGHNKREAIQNQKRRKLLLLSLGGGGDY